ncbi:hypothetical protein QBC33DRAFT_536038 [Phialemonium atrogriseum]|uniref:C2H2-type domain-containing protein n=1 Tax=Phialemonium atrogriseum TaxID=1093897 RepID=A0AAJ0C1Z8_9PEZI|nr:uncharacterized protein QBC33DRAFT_536038 [Phialemonium atrogriseum]KAK1768032.1 hypothetical protein QBC33DRAFT_536038 [Phialemonium atrogriseum]
MEAAPRLSPAASPNLVVSDIAVAPSQPQVASSIGSKAPAATTFAPVNGLPAASQPVASTPASHQSHPSTPAPPGTNENFAASAPVSAPAAVQPVAWMGVLTPQFSSSQPAPRTVQRPPPPASQPTRPQATRYLIMDPPSRLKMTPIPRGSSSGYPSPTWDYARENAKFNDDTTRLTCAVQQSLPEAVRRVVRDNWEKCLLGSEFHQAFILNAAIHHSVPNTTRRAVRDFGGKMVADCKEELMKHFTAKDIDAVAEQILQVASNDFLDKCLEKRLLTIEAKPLIHALARAERLGYEPGDIIEEDHERVIPNDGPEPVLHRYPYPQQPQQQPQQHPHQPPPPPHAPQQPSPQQQHIPQPAAYTPGGRLQCLRCYRVFSRQSTFDYHTSKSVCSRAPPTAAGFKYSCHHCGQGFATSAGLQYHLANKVCGDFEQDTQPLRGPGRPPRARLSSGPGASPVTPQVAQAVQATSAKHVQHAAAAIAAAARSSPSATDPYSHLTQDQFESMQEELREAELKYTMKFKEAETISDPEERRSKLDGLRNSFGTKQSMVRKKYGVRLRERRTKAEIQAEKDRMGLSGLVSKSASQASRSAIPARRSLDTSDQAPTNSSSGWTAANTAAASGPTNGESHDSKRRRIDEGGNNATASFQMPHATATVAASEMGGLGSSAATAAHHDPTLHQTGTPSSSKPATTYQQAGARVEIHLPRSSSMGAARRPSSSPNVVPRGQSSGSAVASRASSAAVVAEEVKLGPANDDSDSDSDDDIADIPAKLPAHVRQSLTPKAGLGV